MIIYYYVQVALSCLLELNDIIKLEENNMSNPFQITFEDNKY